MGPGAATIARRSAAAVWKSDFDYSFFPTIVSKVSLTYVTKMLLKHYDSLPAHVYASITHRQLYVNLQVHCLSISNQ